jgi:tetratricopeptide (TPR) repeat protein
VLIFRLFSVIALALLNGCASSPDTKKTIEPVKIVAAKDKPKLSDLKTAIDPDVLFMLLTAEIAGQRGQYDVALEGYMEAAKRVHDPRFAERAAMIAMYMKDGNRTNEAVSLWLKQDSKNITARKIAAISALRAGKKDQAADHLNSLLKTDPAGFESSVLEIANALQKEGKIAVVNDVLDTLSLKNPDKAVIYYIQSILAMQLKNKAQAETKIKQALKVQPDWDKALIFEAQIAVFSGDLVNAEALLKNAASKYPENSRIKKILAQVLIKEEKYEVAAELYRDIVAADPKDNETQFALGLVYLQLDRIGKAEDIFKKLLEQPDWVDRASFYLGKIEEKKDHSEKALVWYDKVANGPFVFESSISAISLLSKNKQYEEAAGRLNQLKIQFPKQKLRLILLQAELLSQQKSYQKAYDLLTAALQESPDQKELLYTRALTAERIGKLDVLEADLKKILAKNPDNSEALNALGYTLLDMPSRYAEAEKYLEHALRLQPNEAVIMDSYGWLQFKLGNKAKALQYLEKAYAKQKENEIAAHLAEVLWDTGRKDEAKKIFFKAFKEAPEDEYLLDFHKRILSPSE